MLDTSPANLRQEIEAAEKVRKVKLAKWQEMIGSYAGPAWGNSDAPAAPDNHAYEYLSLMIPRVIHNNPRVHARSRRQGPPQDVAIALEYGENRWIQDVNLRSKLVPLAYDSSFAYGIAFVCQDAQPGYETMMDSSLPHWPTVHRISPGRFVFDPLALSWEECRFMGHKCVRDKADLLEAAQNDPESGWDAQAVGGLGTDANVSDLPERKGQGDPPSRKEIAYYEVWVPEAVMEGFDGSQGFHGTIFTVSCDTDKYLRAPRPYYGPRWGPYTMFGTYVVPDSPFPLGQLQATYQQASNLNKQSESMNSSAENYKRIVIVDSAAKKLAQQAKSGKHDYVYSVDGVDSDSKVHNVEIGGITQQQVRQREIMKETLDRVSGMSDVQRGNVSGEATATEVAVADNSSTQRTAFIKQQFVEAVNRLLKTVAWFLYHDDRVVFPLGADAAQAMGMLQPWYFGGTHEDGSGFTFDDLDIQIESYSMERTDETTLQRNAMSALEITTQIAPMIPQMPYVKWDKLLRMVGDAMNMPEFAEIIDTQMATLMMGMMPMQPAGQPALAGQVGAGTPQLPGASPTQNPQAADSQYPAMSQSMRMGTMNGQSRSKAGAY